MIENQHFNYKIQELCQKYDLDIKFYVDENAGFTSEIQYDNFMISRGPIVIGYFPISGKYNIGKEIDSTIFRDKMFFSKIKYCDVSSFVERYLDYLNDKLFEEYILKCCIVNKGFICERNS